MSLDRREGWRAKRVLITGAASGIGLACARRLAEDGPQLVLLGRTDVDEPAGDETTCIRGAVSGAGVADCLAQAVLKFEGLDAAINCAGVKGDLIPTGDQEDDAHDARYTVNALGACLALKSELRQMIAQRFGAIVNVSSIFGIRSSSGFGLYGATKRAVAGLTKAAAFAAAKYGVRLNAVAPGPVDRPSFRDVFSVLERSSPVSPLGRFAEAEEIADAMFWMAGGEASSVTGAIAPVDCGLGAQERHAGAALR